MCFGGKGISGLLHPVGAVLGDKDPARIISEKIGGTPGKILADPAALLSKGTKDPAPAPLAPPKAKKKPAKTALGEVPPGKTALGA